MIETETVDPNSIWREGYEALFIIYVPEGSTCGMMVPGYINKRYCYNRQLSLTSALHGFPCRMVRCDTNETETSYNDFKLFVAEQNFPVKWHPVH